MFDAFSDREDMKAPPREFTMADLLSAISDTVPLSKTMESQLTALRDWAKGKARHASQQKEQVKVGRRGRRALDS